MPNELTGRGRPDEAPVLEDAVDIAEDDEDAKADKYLLFNLGREVYGIGIGHILEIIELQKITDVPDMPAYIRGVINLRGKIIPAMDLRLRFHLEERPYDDRSCIIIVQVADRLVGLVVDTVEEVQDIPLDHIEPAPDFVAEAAGDKFLSGLARSGEDVRIILDVEKIAHFETRAPLEPGKQEVTDENQVRN
jgi:purine-binding chemotaxis protein CheW